MDPGLGLNLTLRGAVCGVRFVALCIRDTCGGHHATPHACALYPDGTPRNTSTNNTQPARQHNSEKLRSSCCQC